MTLDDYQLMAHATADYPVIGENYIYPVIGLAGEVGEVCEKVKKIFRDYNGVMSEERKRDITKELGDVLWYVSEISFCLNIRLQQVADSNIAKLCDRQARGTLHGSGDNR